MLRLCGFYSGICFTTEKKHGKTSVRVGRHKHIIWKVWDSHKTQLCFVTVPYFPYIFCQHSGDEQVKDYKHISSARLKIYNIEPDIKFYSPKQMPLRIKYFALIILRRSGYFFPPDPHSTAPHSRNGGVSRQTNNDFRDKVRRKGRKSNNY